MTICYNVVILLMQFGLRLKLAGYLVLEIRQSIKPHGVW